MSLMVMAAIVTSIVSPMLKFEQFCLHNFE